MKKRAIILIIVSLFVACSRSHDMAGISSSSMVHDEISVDTHNNKWKKVTSQLPTDNL